MSITDPGPDLITVPAAAEEYSVQPARLRQWIHRGHLQRMGRKPGYGRGGGSVLVSRADLERLILHPPRPGPKSPVDTPTVTK